MQLDVKFQEPFSYSYLGVIGLVILIVSLFAYLLIKIYKINSKVKTHITKGDYLEFLKSNYIKELEDLAKKFNDKKISERRAYNKLSSSIRSFVFEVTSIDVLKCTLSDIRKLKIDNLTELVEEYYEPEFSKEGKGNIVSSIEKTKGVILKWK